jgi:chemotaxis protein histidine kinase CheA
MMAIFDNDIDEDLVDDFKDHFSIMTSTIGLLLSKLKEKTSHNFHDNIDELSRIFHNIKASSIYFKLNEISELAQKAEDVLNTLLSTSDTKDDVYIDWLFMVHTQFEIWLKDMLHSSSSLSTTSSEVYKFNINI